METEVNQQIVSHQSNRNDAVNNDTFEQAKFFMYLTLGVFGFLIFFIVVIQFSNR